MEIPGTMAIPGKMESVFPFGIANNQKSGVGFDSIKTGKTLEEFPLFKHMTGNLFEKIPV